MAPRYRSRFSASGNSKMLKRKPKLKGGGFADDALDMVEKHAPKVKKVMNNRRKVAKKINKKVQGALEEVNDQMDVYAAEGQALVKHGKKAAKKEYATLKNKWSKDPMSAISRGSKLLHSHEHAIRVAEKLSPTMFQHIKHGASTVHEKMTGGGLVHDIMHADHHVGDLKDFIHRYGKVPLGALKDLNKVSSPLQLARGLRAELYDRHYNKWKGAGLYQAFGTASDAVIHHSKKTYRKAARVYHQIKNNAPAHLGKVDYWLQHAKHANRHVQEHIDHIKDASNEISSYQLTSGLSPDISMLGEQLKNATDHVHHKAMHLTNTALRSAVHTAFQANHAANVVDDKLKGGKIDWDKVGENARKAGKTIGKAGAAIGAAGVAAGTILTAGGMGEVGIPLGVSSAAIGASGWALNTGLDKNAQFAF
jgi:hypothetical protein